MDVSEAVIVALHDFKMQGGMPSEPAALWELRVVSRASTVSVVTKVKSVRVLDAVGSLSAGICNTPGLAGSWTTAANVAVSAGSGAAGVDFVVARPETPLASGVTLHVSELLH